MSWLSNALGLDKRTERAQSKGGPGAGAQMDSFTRGLGTSAQGYDQNYGADRSAWLNALQGGQAAFEQSARGAIDAAMPSLYGALNQARSSAIQRGVANGELGTSMEGDVFSAFQKNIANALSGQALNLWNSQTQGFGNLTGMDANMTQGTRGMYGDALAGALDRKQQQRNNKQSMWNSLINAGGSIIGGAIGAGALV